MIGEYNIGLKSVKLVQKVFPGIHHFGGYVHFALYQLHIDYFKINIIIFKAKDF